METKEIKSFVKETLARITGNKDQAVAEKNYRLSNAAISGQLSSLESEKVKGEVKLDTAKENLSAAIYPTKMISDSEKYVASIAEKQEEVDKAEDALESIENSITYFTKLKEKINQ